MLQYFPLFHLHSLRARTAKGDCRDSLTPRLTDSAAIQYLIENEGSLIRWGDGESAYLVGRGIYHQTWNFRSWLRVLQILDERSSILLAVPYEAVCCEGRIRDVPLKWRLTSYICARYLLPRSRIADAMIFRPEGGLPNQEIERLWIDSEVVVFVHSNYKYYVDFRDRYRHISVEYVHVRAANACDDVCSTVAQVLAILAKQRPCKARILVSAGIAAKIIVYELALSGAVAFDMGHYFDYKFYNLTQSWKRVG